jgi:hypothetical protein
MRSFVDDEVGRWGCGAWSTRAFRLIEPGQVEACRADEWDVRVATA